MGKLRSLGGIVVGLGIGALGANACSARGEATRSGSATSGGPGTGAGGAATGAGGATATSTSTTGSGGVSTTGSGGGTGATSSGSQTTTGAGGGGVDGGTTGAGGGEDAACAATSSEASAQPQPADIIIAVDTSGSMDAESAQVQQNLNAFATIITNAGIDVHVVMIADASVCIPAPLGSGACGGNDQSLPAYRHVVQGVASNDALEKILSTYPQWQPSLRANASKTFLVVSDDDSSMSAQTFTNALLALDPPTFQGFKFDAVVSATSPDSCIFGGCFFNCASCNNPCCDQATFCSPLSAAEGTVYKELVQQTGGVGGDLCAQDFGPVFQSMATAIVSNTPISCEYDIPAIPDGGMIDPTKVNVAYTPGGGMPQTIGNVPSAADCTPQNGGWYYDDPQSPTKVILCPSTCTAVQSSPNGKVEVLFGCATIHI